jgi:hypothetical protein
MDLSALPIANGVVTTGEITVPIWLDTLPASSEIVEKGIVLGGTDPTQVAARSSDESGMG